MKTQFMHIHFLVAQLIYASIKGEEIRVPNIVSLTVAITEDESFHYWTFSYLKEDVYQGKELKSLSCIAV